MSSSFSQGFEVEHSLIATANIDIWLVDLQNAASLRQLCWQLLSKDEQERAVRFRFATHQDRFIATRGILRQLLGHYLGLRAAEISFDYTKYGKPLLRQCPVLHFNLAHSDCMSVFALSWTCPVGVDIEEIRELPDFGTLCSTVFSKPEMREIDNLSEGKRLQTFFAGWTRKEAYLKADGSGLLKPLHDVGVSLDLSRLPRLLWINGSPGEAACWSLYEFKRASRFVGALAARALSLRVEERALDGAFPL